MLQSLGKILILGASGLVGSHLKWVIEKRGGYEKLLTPSSKELDLTRQEQVEAYFALHQPKTVFFVAGKVGGILANAEQPAEFGYDNLAMALHVIKSAHNSHVDRLFYMGSSCIYPKLAPQPLRKSSS